MSTRAKAAIGIGTSKSFDTSIKIGDPADFVLFGSESSRVKSFRSRKTVREVVYDAGYDRVTVFNGKVVSQP